MDNKTEERLLNLFSEASGEASSKSPVGVRASDAEETPAAEDRSHVESAAEYTSGPAEAPSFDASLDGGAGQSYHGTSGSGSASGSSSSSGGIGSTLESVAGSVFGGALGLVPLVGSLFGLFGSKSTQQPAFEKYEMPSSISFEAADTSGGLANADYGQMGLPRLYDSSDAGAASPGNGASSGSVATNASAISSAPVASSSQDPSSSFPGGAAASGGGSGMPQISVNVQAMDAQSFMSYSGEIAKAVRDAMLNLSSINDVVTEL
jgi:hypothetical protein